MSELLQTLLGVLGGPTRRQRAAMGADPRRSLVGVAVLVGIALVAVGLTFTRANTAGHDVLIYAGVGLVLGSGPAASLIHRLFPPAE